MKILIDGRVTMGGIERYAQGLIRRLAEILPRSDLIVFGRQGGHDPGACSSLQPQPRRGPVRACLGHLKRIGTDQWVLPAVARGKVAEVFHSLNFFVPRRMNIPAVVTCHDLWLLESPDSKKRGWMKHYERRSVLTGLRRAAHVITPSDAVATRLRDRLDLPEGRVSVIYPVLPELRGRRTPPEEDDAVAPPFFLTVGTLEPRKNLERLLRAHRIAFERCGVPLRLVGAYGWGQAHLVRMIGGSGGAVRWLGHVSDAELARLYRKATGVVQFSLDEGFSYPVSEAMSLDAPLLLSEIPVHREIASDLALYSPPGDIEAAAEHLVRIAAFSSSERAARAARARQRLEWIRRRGEIGLVLDVYEKVRQ